MIDGVQRTLERMAEELESYRDRRIFTHKQIQKIIENRRRFENKLHRTKKKISDFLQYADSEKNLEKLRNKKISELGIGFEESDMILQSNIIKIYEKAIYYFNEPILMKDFSEYCIKKKAFTEMKDVFSKKCLKHSIDTDLWVFCAQKLWEIDDIDGARSIFMKGTGVNNDMRLLIEFFRFECLYAAKLNKINEELGVEEDDKDEIEKGKVALIVFENILKRATEKDIEECFEISKIVPSLEDQMKKMKTESYDE